MTGDAFLTEGDGNLTPDEVRVMLSDAFHAGCELGFSEGLEGAKREVRSQHCEGAEAAIDEICGPNTFAVILGFEKWLKMKGGGP